MKKGYGWLLTVLVVIGSVAGSSLVRAEEYTDPERQAKWEEKQQERAEKAERRRERLSRWIDGNFKKLKPNLRQHRGEDVASSASEEEGELK